MKIKKKIKKEKKGQIKKNVKTFFHLVHYQREYFPNFNSFQWVNLLFDTLTIGTALKRRFTQLK